MSLPSRAQQVGWTVVLTLVVGLLVARWILAG